MKVAEFADALCRKTALLSDAGNASVSAIPSESASRNVSLDISVSKAALTLVLMKKVEATSSKAGVSKVSMPKLPFTSKPSEQLLPQPGNQSCHLQASQSWYFFVHRTPQRQTRRKDLTHRSSPLEC